jgi:hypothetical protein
MWRSLGKVTVASHLVNVRATDNESDSTARWPCHALLFEQGPGNTGRIYVFDRQTGDQTTLEGCLAILAVPTVNMLPSVSATITYAPAGLDASTYWVGASVDGEGVLISAIRA